jgi:hypothetical protein
MVRKVTFQLFLTFRGEKRSLVEGTPTCKHCLQLVKHCLQLVLPR